MKSTLAQRLFSFRETNGLTQEHLAERLHVSRQAISKWECGDAVPDLDNLTALSHLYGVSIDELVGNETTGEERTNVHVSLKDGVNVHHKNKGVHVGWDGIQIDEKIPSDAKFTGDGTAHGNVHITNDGIWVDGVCYDSFKDAHDAKRNSRKRSAFARIPVIPLLVLTFLVLGLFYGEWLLGLAIVTWSFVWSCLANVVDAIYFKRGSKKICDEVSTLLFSCGLSSFLFFGFAFGEWAQVGPYLPFPGWYLILIGLFASIAVHLIWPKPAYDQKPDEME